MAKIRWRGPLRHVGSLHGEGRLFAREQDLGSVRYEIDGFEDQRGAHGNGCIEGALATLQGGFRAHGAKLVLAGGAEVQVILGEPGRGPAAEFEVVGPLPEFK